MQNFIFCQIFSVLFHPVSFPVLLLPAVPALLLGKRDMYGKYIWYDSEAD